MEPGPKSADRRAVRRELLTGLRDRYVRSSKIEKGAILDEFVALTGYNRSYATRRCKRAMIYPSSWPPPTNPHTASTTRPSRSP